MLFQQETHSVNGQGYRRAARRRRALRDGREWFGLRAVSGSASPRLAEWVRYSGRLTSGGAHDPTCSR